MRDAFLKTSMDYYAKGYDVIPLDGKRPFADDWLNQDFKRKKIYTNQYGKIIPLAMRNIGIKTGAKSGLIVVDIDVTDKELQQEIYKQLGPCKCGKIGNKEKGINYFFKYNGEISRAFTGIDILSDGKQSVLPPSDHDNGYEYEWVGESLLSVKELPTLPESFITWCEENFSSNGSSVKLERGEGRCSHGSHNHLSAILVAMIHDGEEIDDIVNRLLDEDEKINQDISYFLCPSRKEYRTNNKKVNCLKMVSEAYTSQAKKGDIPTTAPVRVEIKEQEPVKAKTIPKLPKLRGVAQDMFQNIYNNAPVPRSRFAYASTLTTISTIIGNKIRYNNIHPNIYSLLIAPSGSGKDFPMKYPKRILKKYEMKELLGQENPASDTGLLMTLDKQNKRIDTIDEADVLFSSINGKNSPWASKMADVYASLYTSCGDYYAGKVTAGKGKMGECDNPFVNIIGSITPTALRDSLTMSMIEKGLGARFLYFIDERFKVGNFEQKNEPMTAQMDFFINNWKNFNPIGIPNLQIETKAHNDLKDIYYMCEDLKKKMFKTKLTSIYNRLYENLIKFLIIDTVSTNPKTTTPIISRDNVRWASKAIDCYTKQMEDFIENNVSENEAEKNRQYVYRVIKDEPKISKSDLTLKTRRFTKQMRDNILRELIESEVIGEIKEERRRLYFTI